MNRCRIAAIVLMFVLAVPLAPAQERGGGGTAAPPAVSSGARVALVIGNSAYASAPLRNPVNDAKAMAAVLEQCGFAVIVRTDCTYEAMKKLVEEFGDRIRGAGVALFYYAGHGLQVGGANFLMPVDADIKGESEVEFKCVNAGLVLAKMEDSGAQVNVVVLDACRNNPFARGFRSATQGLALMNAAQGSVIAFSTAPDSVAADGDGQNSLYTESLVRYLPTPGLEIEDVLKRVGAEVVARTQSAQQPWRSSNLNADFYFVAPQVAAAADAPPPPAPSLLGHLQVAVNAPEATIYLDGREAGTATSSKPFERSNLPAGTAQVTVRAEGYEEHTETVSIEPGKWTQKPVVLAKVTVVRPPEPPRPPTAAPPAQPPQVTVTTGEPKPGDVQTVDLGGGVTLELVWIPPGTFLMGGDQSPEKVARLFGGENTEADWFRHEQPQHQVTLTQGFWLGKYEVTQGQWERVMGNNPSHLTFDPRLPVECVSWEDCQEFIDKLNGRVSRGGFRLPTESQWEYACRAGTTTPFCFGQTISTEQANYRGNYTYGNGREGVCRENTVLVGNFPANTWGLYDMHGNVKEWCSDWFGAYPSGSVTDPAGPASGVSRVVRGGSWADHPGCCRSAYRYSDTPDYRFAHLGLRLSRTP
ncbi:MAG: SUMF1/EgtB/PvdO family nonheme iron enzyme [Candidatus Hydrogenedentes bacterium]|nr:SUMF1/EgtB/PvdO family nonheme iron enzyme [Candidatus Hydrogenedentota bacterium]